MVGSGEGAAGAGDNMDSEYHGGGEFVRGGTGNSSSRFSSAYAGGAEDDDDYDGTGGLGTAGGAGSQVQTKVSLMDRFRLLGQQIKLAGDGMLPGARSSQDGLAEADAESLLLGEMRWAQDSKAEADTMCLWTSAAEVG